MTDMEYTEEWEPVQEDGFSPVVSALSEPDATLPHTGAVQPVAQQDTGVTIPGEAGTGTDVSMQVESFTDPGQVRTPLDWYGRTAEASDLRQDEAGGEPAAMPKLLGIRFQQAGQVYFFSASEHKVRIGTKVLVELEQGPALGEVMAIVVDEPSKRPKGADYLEGKVAGLATAQDIASNTENRILGAEAAAFCKTCIRQRNLDMKLVDVEVLHDRSKIIFFFTAPARIDFRELVKDLVRTYRTRIELRQIGVRHETQMIGGLGNCGSVCCCHRFLRKFAPVTIKMAKEQNLFLNPAKLSGMCGRLLCCLSYEQSNYDEFNRRSPKIGKKYATTKGLVKVLRANMFSQSIVCLTATNEELECSLEEWDTLQPRRVESGNEGRSGDDAPDALNGPRMDERWSGDEAFPASMEDDAFSQGQEGSGARPGRQDRGPHAPRSGHGATQPDPQGAARGRKRRHPGQEHRPDEHAGHSSHERRSNEPAGHSNQERRPGEHSSQERRHGGQSGAPADHRPRRQPSGSFTQGPKDGAE